MFIELKFLFKKEQVRRALEINVQVLFSEQNKWHFLSFGK